MKCYFYTPNHEKISEFEGAVSLAALPPVGCTINLDGQKGKCFSGTVTGHHLNVWADSHIEAVIYLRDIKENKRKDIGGPIDFAFGEEPRWCVESVNGCVGPADHKGPHSGSPYYFRELRELDMMFHGKSEEKKAADVSPPDPKGSIREAIDIIVGQIKELESVSREGTDPEYYSSIKRRLSELHKDRQLLQSQLNKYL